MNYERDSRMLLHEPVDDSVLRFETAVGEGVWTRLRRRKVVQWGLVYVAGA